MKKKLVKYISLFLSSLMLVGCGNSLKENKWEYTKDDVKDFIVIEPTLIQISDEEFSLSINSKTEIFTSNDINAKDFILFNNTNLLNSDATYYSYDAIKDNEVEYLNFNVSNNKEFVINFNGLVKTTYGVLFSKDVIKDNNYLISINKSENESLEIQTDFEDEIIETSPGWDQIGFVVDIAGYIAQIVLGAQSGVSTAVSSGIFGLINLFGGTFLGNAEPSIQDVLDKLADIEGKLDFITDKINQNQTQLMNELIRIEAQIDQVLLNQYNSDIANFQKDYVEPVEDILTVYKDYIEQSFKSYVNSTHEITVYYSLNAKGKRVLRSRYENGIEDFESFTFQISSFEESKKCLSEHRNIVTDVFPTYFLKDINNMLDKSNAIRPNDRDDLANDIYTSIVDEFQAIRYRDPNYHDEALSLMNNVKKFANRIAGSASNSVVLSYFNRIKMMFNFAGETRKTLEDLCANLRNTLDNYLLIAQSACIFAGINSSDMAYAYFDAHAAIKNYYNIEKNLDDRYCYHMNQVLEGNFFNSVWDISYSHLGNHPTFTSSYKTRIVESFFNRNLSMREININELNILDKTSHQRIYAKYKMLKEMEYTKKDTYITYLIETQVMSENSYHIYLSMKQAGYIGGDALRFLTNVSIRDLTKNDTNISFTCTCYGNPDSEYMNIGSKYNYMYDNGDIESKYWSGKIAEGDFINAETCASVSNRKIAAYARYHESHALWIDDEIFGLLDNTLGSFYYMLYTRLN